jgi:transcriptional regulator with XRE-family HTH domain
MDATMDSGAIAMATPRRQVTPLRRAIFEAGLTQAALARIVGIDEADMSRIVNGLHPSEDRRQKIANALRWPVDELWPTQPEEAA